MSWTKVSSLSDNLGSGGGTSSSIDTTGADLLVLTIHYFNSLSAPTDFYSNTWTQVFDLTPAGAGCAVYICNNPSVGSGHTFSTTSNFSSIEVLAYSGADLTDPLDQSATAAGGATSAQPGSVTPSEDDELLVAVVSLNMGTGSFSNLAIDSSFNIQESIAYVDGMAIGGAMADKIQTSAGAENPQWTWTSNATVSKSGIATFKAAAAGSSVLEDEITLSTSVNDTKSNIANLFNTIQFSNESTITDVGSIDSDRDVTLALNNTYTNTTFISSDKTITLQTTLDQSNTITLTSDKTINLSATNNYQLDNQLDTYPTITLSNELTYVILTGSDFNESISFSVVGNLVNTYTLTIDQNISLTTTNNYQLTNQIDYSDSVNLANQLNLITINSLVTDRFISLDCEANLISNAGLDIDESVTFTNTVDTTLADIITYDRFITLSGSLGIVTATQLDAVDSCSLAANLIAQCNNIGSFNSQIALAIENDIVAASVNIYDNAITLSNQLLADGLTTKTVAEAVTFSTSNDVANVVNILYNSLITLGVSKSYALVVIADYRRNITLSVVKEMEAFLGEPIVIGDILRFVSESLTMPSFTDEEFLN